jgi:hypothetical protein
MFKTAPKVPSNQYCSAGPASNTCLLNNLLILKIHVEIGILYRILYLPFTKFWFLKFLTFLPEQYN